MAFIGYSSIRTAINGTVASGDKPSPPRGHSYLTGFLMAAFNPFGIIYWLTVGAGLAADAEGAGSDHATRWSVVAQQTLFSPRHYPSGVTSTDSWDGYPAARVRLLQAVAGHGPRNTVLLGGDIHQNYVCRVHADPARADSPVVASEFCGTSISSRSGTTQEKVDAIVRNNPHVLLGRCDQRGYGMAEITPTRWTTALRVLDDPLSPDSGISTLARFVVEDGHPGPQRA